MSKCNALNVVIGACVAVAVPANSFLMFLRVKAVYLQNRIAIRVFTFLWAATLLSSVTLPFSVRGDHIGTSQQCIETDIKPLTSACFTVSAVNDTLIFLAVTYRLVFFYAEAGSWSSRVRSLFSGAGMGQTAKLLLQTGQLYYL